MQLWLLDGPSDLVSPQHSCIELIFPYKAKLIAFFSEMADYRKTWRVKQRTENLIWRYSTKHT